MKRMETEYKHAIGVILLVLGGLLTFWAGGVYYAVRTTLTLAAMVATGVVAVIGLILLFLK
jgi:hypothetical protein